MTSSRALRGRPRRRPRALAGLVLALMLNATVGAPAFAQVTAADLESARALVREGRDLRTRGDLRGALEKFKAAHAVGHTAVTGIELARTHERLGELVEAREVALSIARLPVEADETERSSAARAEATKLAETLRSRVPSLTLTVAPQGPVDVVIDGDPLPAAALGHSRRLNPGTHTIVARRGAGPEVRETVTLAEGETRTLALRVPVNGKAEGSTDASKPEERGANAGTNVAPVVEGSRTPRPAERNRVPALVAWSIAGASLAMGTGFGVAATVKKGELDCPNFQCVDDDQQSALDNARNLASSADVFFVLGTVAAVTGVVLWFGAPTKSFSDTAPARARTPSSAPVRDVSVGIAGAGLRLEGAF